MYQPSQRHVTNEHVSHEHVGTAGAAVPRG